MPASEYGSYYWCVLLREAQPDDAAGVVYLHADGMNIDSAGNLKFTSAGRRPVGAEPSQVQNVTAPHEQNNEGKNNAHSGEKDQKDQDAAAGMIYMAFAAGTWKAVYAAKLRDGSPACVEHWVPGREGLESSLLHSQHGAAGFSEM